MSDPRERLGQPVIAFSADGRDWGRGVVIAYTDAPTFVIERPDGSRFSWRSDLCLPYDDDQEATA